MIIISEMKNKKVLVFGLGKTGIGAIKSLLASEADVIASDDNSENLNSLKNAFPSIKTALPSEVNFNEIDLLVLSPGVPIAPHNAHAVFVNAKKHGVKICSDLDLLFQAAPNAKYIGITGTNGKSTTSALIAHTLKELGVKTELGGNIGTSVLELSKLDSDGVYVIETSSYQLDLITDIKFDISIFLNLTPDHIDRHGSMEAYKQAKVRIFEHQKGEKLKIISKDYPILDDVVKKFPDAKTFSTKTNADYSFKNRVLTFENNPYSFTDYQFLLGEHNEENIASAFAAVNAIVNNPVAVSKAIKSFKGLRHRNQEIFRIGNLVFVNDSKATNAEAAEKAILCYENIYLILGGVPKEGGIEYLSPHFKRVKEALLIGEASDSFAETLSRQNVTHSKLGTLDAALEYVKNKKITDGVVLLSPACASFDQFKNFEHRGEEFERMVKEKFGG